MTSLDPVRANMRDTFVACRAGTLDLFAQIDDSEFREQPHPWFSPVGWHLGHIAYTEGLWLLKTLGGVSLPRPDLEPVFDVKCRRNKAERCNLPPVAEVLGYLGQVRDRVFARLAAADLDQELRLWHFILQHESQHSETVAFLHQLQNGPNGIEHRSDASGLDGEDLIAIPTGSVTIGSDRIDALDNERPSHRREIDGFRISRFPVTQSAFQAFMDAGGYETERWWTAEGWTWRTTNGIDRPLYWRDGASDHPVSGVSAHEAEAWCRFRGVRLPTEFEWEKAAGWDPATDTRHPYPWGETPPDGRRCNHDRLAAGTSPVTAHRAGRSPTGVMDMLGNVWEWTSSNFSPYEGFQSFPYEGYSAAYFDGNHRVLRGGSWATRPWMMRTTVRNWYTPDVRQILAGFRYAKDGLEG